MSHYYDDPADAPVGRAGQTATHTPPHTHMPPPAYAQQTPMYGPQSYGMPIATTRRLRRYGSFSETKPFFLTSEFAAVVLSVIALGITAAASESVDARLFWIITSVFVAAYVVSRGLAKAGTRSRAYDPREDLDPSRMGFGRDSHAHDHH